jgi:preprotein translocase subunit SecY
MFQTLKNAWKITELRNKLLFTLLIIILYRVGANIPVPFINSELIENSANYFVGIFDYMNWLSGGALSQATLFALSVSPYITSSIIIQLLCVAIPALERWSKDGEAGKKKINALTRYVTVGLALITSYGYMKLLDSGMGSGQSFLVEGAGFFAKLVIVACYCAGASLIMWLAEKVNEFGIGNGISMILFANIIAGIPSLVSGLWAMVVGAKYLAVGIILGVVSLIITLAVIVFIVLVNDSERRIPIQYAKKVVGRKMYGGANTNLPLKVNMSGVMPIIFASSIVSIPATIGAFFPNVKWLSWLTEHFSYDSWIYIVLYLVLIVAFAYFYIMISFNPVETANNIQNNGGAIRGVRPGKPTVEFITKILNRITLIGALFLCIIAGLPMIINAVFQGSFTGIAFGGNSLLIVIGVALETVRDLEAQITLRNYKGFLD